MRFLLSSLCCMLLTLVSFARGILCLTFDDRHFESWQTVAEKLELYGGRATFFPCGVLSDADLDVLEALAKRGHSIGTHTVSHLSVPEQCTNWLKRWLFFRNEIRPHQTAYDKRNIPLHCFAYPYGLRSSESDLYLAETFRKIRLVLRCSKISTTNELFIPVDNVSATQFFPSAGVGAFYKTDRADIKDALRRCHAEDKCLVLFTHGVYTKEKCSDTDMTVELLDELLQLAKQYNIQLKGMNDL